MSVLSVEAMRRSGGRIGRVLIARPRLFGALLGGMVVVLLAAPALFTRSGFIDDWVNHMWLTWMQSRQIRATGLPSLFLNADPLGVFYPNFLFYGGTLYAVGGYLMVVTGAPVAVFVGILVAAFCAAYGGTLWIARQAGVSGLAAHLPPMIVVTSAYYLSLAYGRGSWPELVATSAIPLLIGAALRILRAGPAPGSVIALGIATIFWSGSHNISFAWGSIFLAGVGLSMLVAWTPQLTAAYVRRGLIVLGVVALGVMVNGWFLLPDVRYSLHTGVAQVNGIATSISDPFSRASIVFDPFRPRASQSPYLRSHFTELPVLLIAWVAITAVALWRSHWSRPLRRLFLLLGLLTASLSVLLMDDNAWRLVPVSLTHIQFTFRLETYIVMAIAGLVTVLLRTLNDLSSTRIPAGPIGVSLIAIVLVGLGLAGWQVWNSNAGYYPSSPAFLKNRAAVFRYPNTTPPTWYAFELLGSFRDASARVVPTYGSIHLDPAKVTGSSTTQDVTIPAGTGALASNIAAPMYIISVHGLHVVGRTAEGYLALQRPPSRQKTVRVTIGRANTTAMRLGPPITLTGIIGLAAAVLASALLPPRLTNRKSHAGNARTGSWRAGRGIP